eukprot:TRINITY_DN86060_c0_g1_i1.p1 TRINITY_DN86060_c0_g1~~TRINITY_DN86060_c0_g1_i1.p1  ORF type:complete len:258 (+),score=3.38 TRINITY_DN86060_c0_g1_i1:280-1053(+)
MGHLLTGVWLLLDMHNTPSSPAFAMYSWTVSGQTRPIAVTFALCLQAQCDSGKLPELAYEVVSLITAYTDGPCCWRPPKLGYHLSHTENKLTMRGIADGVCEHRVMVDIPLATTSHCTQIYTVQLKSVESSLFHGHYLTGFTRYQANPLLLFPFLTIDEEGQTEDGEPVWCCDTARLGPCDERTAKFRWIVDHVQRTAMVEVQKSSNGPWRRAQLPSKRSNTIWDPHDGRPICFFVRLNSVGDSVVLWEGLEGYRVH